MTELRLKAVAVVVAAHGIKGQVKLRLLSDLPDSPLLDERGNGAHRIKLGSLNGDIWIASIEGISDRTQAELLKKKVFYRALQEDEQLQPEGESLIGLKINDQNGQLIGEVTGVDNFGAGDLVEIAFLDGTREMYPFNDVFFPRIDMKAGTASFLPPEVV